MGGWEDSIHLAMAAGKIFVDRGYCNFQWHLHIRQGKYKLHSLLSNFGTWIYAKIHGEKGLPRDLVYLYSGSQSDRT